MKVIDSEIFTEEHLSWDEIAGFVEELDHNAHIWLTLYDNHKDKPNYVQVHSEVGESELEVAGLHCIGRYEINDDSAVFVIEARVHSSRNVYKHFRIYTADKEVIKDCFWAYYYDEPYNFDEWMDVSSEF